MKKEQQQRINDALSKALQPPKPKPSASLNNILAQYTPPPSPSEPPSQYEPPASREAPAPDAAGSQKPPQPLHGEPAAQREPPSPNAPARQILSAKSPHLRFPYEVLDHTLNKVNPLPRVVLLRLYRLSAGFDSNTCHVSIGKLSLHCKIGETKIRACLRELERDGYIRRVSIDVRLC